MRTPNSLRKTAAQRLIAALLMTVSSAAAAQTEAPAASTGRRPWTVTPYVGISRHSPVGHLWGLTPDRHHVLVGLHATFPLLQRRRWLFAYAPEAIPLIVVSNNPTYASVPNISTGERQSIESGRSNVAGAGVAPIALELQFDAARRFGVYAAGSMGGLWFTRNIPVADARSFNFTFDFGGGVRLRLNDRHALRLGYKFHHLSNAKTAPSNPGVDAKVFLLGIERAFGAR